MSHILRLCFYKADFSESVADMLISSLPFGENEQKRLLSIKNSKKRRESLSALMALKELLNEADVNASTDTSVFRTPTGKPCFASLPLHFSLSHIDGLAVCALSDIPVGIDMEWIDSDRNILDISRRFFLQEEQAYIEESSEPLLAFYSVWTKKEAYAKLTGEGLAGVLASRPAPHCKQYILELEGKGAVISVCSEATDDILIYDSKKEFKIYELQN